MHGKFGRKTGVTVFDALLAVFFLAAAILIWVLLLKAPESGAVVEITSGGEVFGTYSLSEDARITVTNGEHENTVVIENGAVTVESANCPDKYCVRHKAIQYRNECIVCLPARLVVTVSGGEEGVFDAYTG